MHRPEYKAIEGGQAQCDKIFSIFLLTIVRGSRSIRRVMSSIVKNTKGLLGVTVFVLGLWAFVVVTYAAQVKQDSGHIGRLMPMTQTSCSSSSSSSTSTSNWGPPIEP